MKTKLSMFVVGLFMITGLVSFTTVTPEDECHAQACELVAMVESVVDMDSNTTEAVYDDMYNSCMGQMGGGNRELTPR